MFIYKITNIETNLCYIGLDTKDEYKQKRWKDHQRDCCKVDSKFYLALRNNIENFTYEVIFRTSEIEELLLKEIEYISYYNSYKNGYNSSPGGDAFGYRKLKSINPEVYKQIIQIRREWTQSFNEKKWEDTTAEERKFLCKHLHTAEITKKKSESLKDYWQFADEDRKQLQLRGLKIKWADLPEHELTKRSLTNKRNGLAGAAKVSKKIKIQFADGTTKIYQSKSEFNREHGEIINAILQKTKDNKTHRGFKGWEI